MTQSEKLQKVIEKAVKNRYQFQGLDTTELILTALITRYQNDISIMVFSHDFAKAFWGDQKHDYLNRIASCRNCDAILDNQTYCWQYHIQQLVLTPEDERIDYLYSFI